MKQNRVPLSKPLAVKLDPEFLERLRAASRKMGEPVSTVMRIAMRIGLDAISNLAVKEPEAVLKALNSLHPQTEIGQLSSAKIETHSGEILDAALNEPAGAGPSPPVPGDKQAAPVHYGKGKRKRAK